MRVGGRGECAFVCVLYVCCSCVSTVYSRVCVTACVRVVYVYVATMRGCGECVCVCVREYVCVGGGGR